MQMFRAPSFHPSPPTAPNREKRKVYGKTCGGVRTVKLQKEIPTQPSKAFHSLMKTYGFYSGHQLSSSNHPLMIGTRFMVLCALTRSNEGIVVSVVSS